jgi:hypothetical protein
MSEVTRLLNAAAAGDRDAAADLLPLVYDELRKLAAARKSQESLLSRSDVNRASKLLGSIPIILSALAAENLAIRQQLAVLRRSGRRPQL